MSASGCIVWLTGEPSSGKTTIAEVIVNELRKASICVVWLDSDDLRTVITPHADYSQHERDVFYKAIGHIAALVAQGPSVVVVSATAAKRHYRQSVRDLIDRFVEVWIRCPLDERKKRDPKGLYRAAGAKKIQNFPGYSTPYEPPLAADVEIDTTVSTPSDAAKKILDFLNENSLNLPMLAH